jgi:hypothetical protein
MHKPTMLWRPTSGNTKTGNIPQGYVGITKAETEESCDGCSWRKSGCYYWRGRARGGHNAMSKRYTKHPREYSLTHALRHSLRSAKYVRGSVGGDPWPFSRDQVTEWRKQVYSAGLKGLLLYTHFWQTKGEHLRTLAMASCDTFEEADTAVRRGWRAAVTITTQKAPDSQRSWLNKTPAWSGEQYITPDGHQVYLCPAQVGRTNCNNCGLCDPARPGPAVIGFLVH